MVRRKQRSCYQCRSRHLKCDGEEPCGNCRLGARQCNKEDTHIFLDEANLGIVRRKKRYDFAFDGTQQWIDLPATVNFTSSTVSSSSANTPPGFQEATQVFRRNSAPQLDSSPSGTSVLDAPCALNVQVGLSSGIGAELSADTSSTQWSLPRQCSSAWPLKTYEEAQLYRYYITHLADWFDEGDTLKHFTIILPELAQSCPALLNAILAFSAKQLGLRGELSTSVCLHYQDECYKALLPELQEKAFEAPYLAAVLLLRMVLYMTDNETSLNNDRTSFLGLGVFLDALQSHPSSSLHAAIFMNILRLYVHVAFANERPIDLVQVKCEWICNNLPIPTDSRGWEWKATVEVARVVNLMYDDQPKTVERWGNIEAFALGWESAVPSYFKPMFEQDVGEGDPFPKILFSNEVHASAFIYHNIARLALLNNMPGRSPQQHPAFTHPQIQSPEEVKEQSYAMLRRICGAAICHSHSVPTVLKATLAISYVGNLFTTKAERDAASTLMQKAESHFPGMLPRRNYTGCGKYAQFAWTG